MLGGPEGSIISRSTPGHPESRSIPRRDSSEKTYCYVPEGRGSATSHPQQGLGQRESQTGIQPTSNYPFMNRSQVQTAQYERRMEEPSSHDRTIDSPSSGRTNRNQHHGGVHASRGNREPEGRPADHQSLQELRQSLIPALAGENQNAREVQSARVLMPTSASSDQLVASGDEAILQPKHLSLFPDKRGRASPLPQAMQGAQARLRGPTGEPGIKHEFGRVFPGLGSGVGSAVSTPIPSDAQPPRSFPSSPAPGDEGARRTPLSMRDLGDAPSRIRNSSRPAGKKSRKAKDDDIKRESDMDGVGLARTLSGGRGQKRSRQSYHTTSSPLNHHASLAHQNLDQPRRTFTPNQGLSSSVSVPHHHHVLQVHHHHTHKAPTPAPVPIPVLPSRKPNITVNSKAVYDRIKHLPRHHLGSTIYQTKIEQPSNDPAEVHSKFGYVSTPVPIPRFDEKENCTFTVRVPRYFLDRMRREEICERRALWGVEIYTDDSDPIAVAIHSGWIRGEWDEDVDVSMLDLGTPDDETEEKIRQLESSNEPSIVMTEPLSVPIHPLKNRELHITLLIMPRLESYGSTVAHGLKSRAWKTKHDGMSFKIERIAWVDPKSSKCEARGGEARRKRMRARLYPESEKGSGPVIEAKLFAIEQPKETQLTASAA